MTALLVVLGIGCFFFLSALTFKAGFYTAQMHQSDAMVRHHERMLLILDGRRIPEFDEVSQSLDMARTEIHSYEPSFFKDFLGKV